MRFCVWLFFFFFNDTATTEIYTLSLHDALPILVNMVKELDHLSIDAHGEALQATLSCHIYEKQVTVRELEEQAICCHTEILN